MLYYAAGGLQLPDLRGAGCKSNARRRLPACRLWPYRQALTMAAKSKRKRKETARKGGLALYQKRGRAWMVKIGRKGGREYVKRYAQPMGWTQAARAARERAIKDATGKNGAWGLWRSEKRGILKALKEQGPQEFP